MLAFLHHDFPADHPFQQIPLMPTVTARPDPWILGSSGSSAGLAAALGIGYSFAGFINPGGAVPALRVYRKTFKPTQYGAQTPQVMLGVAVFAADTDEEAHRMTWPTGPSSTVWAAPKPPLSSRPSTKQPAPSPPHRRTNRPGSSTAAGPGSSPAARDRPGPAPADDRADRSD
ncbi:LLM class flavin-dependent oxidoreductase [Streptomyces sp. NPDC050433]|uniref:LLM class flavin-dependent oxidoreductase n=1 Tax=Streptomyces sp. NPDC050433 TaxID=3365615 RepID=UPI0037B3BD59